MTEELPALMVDAINPVDYDLTGRGWNVGGAGPKTTLWGPLVRMVEIRNKTTGATGWVMADAVWPTMPAGGAILCKRGAR